MAKVCTPLPRLPLNLFDRARELYRDIRWKRRYWNIWWRIHTFRSRRRQRNQMKSLLDALSVGSYGSITMVKTNPGALQIESLGPTMQVVTFDPIALKLTT